MAKPGCATATWERGRLAGIGWGRDAGETPALPGGGADAGLPERRPLLFSAYCLLTYSAIVARKLVTSSGSHWLPAPARRAVAASAALIAGR